MENIKKSNEQSNKITKECLHTAIIKLMSIKTYDEITITELVNTAGVSRTAFYRNYKTKDDILNEMTALITKQIYNQDILNKFNDNPYGWYLEFFKTLLENKSSIILLGKAQLLNIDVFYNNNFLLPLNLKNISSYEIAAFYGAINAVVVKWIENDMKDSPHEMASICIKLFNKD